MNNLFGPLMARGGVVAFLIALDANGVFWLRRIAVAPPMASDARS